MRAGNGLLPVHACAGRSGVQG